MSKKPAKSQANQLDAITADLQRVQADFINYKRRVEEDSTRLVSLSQAELLLNFLPTLDNIERAFQSIPKELASNPWAQGIVKTAEQLFNKLSEIGLEKLEVKGKSFDPNLMDAVSVEGEGDHEVVAEELQTGYKFKDEILRHAIVKIKKS